MKKNLLYVGFGFFTLFYYSKLQSQCTVSDLAIELKSTVPVTGGCRVIFNFSWTQEVNNGNKFAYVHLWNTSQYPDLLANGLAYTNPPDYPTNSDLVNALATIVIDSNGTANPVIGTEYHPQTSVPVLTTGLIIRKRNINSSMERMTVENIILIIPNCTGSGITGDIWASQASNGKNVHCVSSGVSVVVGNPTMLGSLLCNVPRQYSLQINNLATSAISVSYNILIDEGDGIYEPFTHDLKITSSPVGPFTIAGSSNYQSGLQSYLPYSGQKPYSDHGLWVEAITGGFPNKTIYFIENSCIPLPVYFKSFTAQRNGYIVTLKWQTATELNNTGFEIQRKTGTGNFETIDFVPSKATDGNSQAELSYSYDDINISNVISEYRLKQIDFSRQSTYTEIKAVKGIGQPSGIVIYPNPSSNGKMHILFDDMNVHNISIIDMNGRVIKQWDNYADNNLSVVGLLPGIYFLRVVDRTNGKIMPNKFVIAGR